MKLGLRRVTKDWPVRLQISVFTMPAGSTVIIRQTHEGESVVEFGERDIDWFDNSTIERYTEELLLEEEK